MDAFERRAARRLREMSRELCKHAIGPVRCHQCGQTHCAVCQPVHVCKETR